jgi:lipoate-protein ligase B
VTTHGYALNVDLDPAPFTEWITACGLDDAQFTTMARELERPLGVEATRIEGLTGIWLERPPRKIASIGIHISKWVTTHGYALNVDLDPAPFTEWITACGLEDAAFTTVARELDRSVSVDEVRPPAVAALEEVFSLRLERVAAPVPVQA